MKRATLGLSATLGCSAALGLSAAFGLSAALGCSSAREQAPPLARDAGSARPEAAITNAPATDAPAAAPPAPLRAIAAGATPRPGDRPYARFFAALRDLERGNRKEHVRITWLGDSHGAADFWSGALRTALQRRFGDGGPGFVHLGYAMYRHDRARVVAGGKWRTRPRKPAATKPSEDGIFGLGGMLFGAERGAVQAQLTVTEAAPSARLLWDLCVRLNAPEDAVDATLADSDGITVKPSPGDVLGDPRHVALVSNGAATLTVTPSGTSELCGVVVETDPAVKPGVVLDTLGINGARLATALTWSELHWASELARRDPALAIIEYGTNESGDVHADPAIYGKHLEELVARIRRVNPDVDCLVLAPTDRKDTADRTPLVRDVLRDAAQRLECGFWDTYEAMGGAGSITAWRAERPPRASRDGVHLTGRGYRELGFQLAEHLLGRYRP